MPDTLKDKILFNVHNHPRFSEFNRLVYPVLSRRAGGLSLGINLNPSKSCSYHCLYCQVDRQIETKNLKVSLTQIKDELAYWINAVRNKEDSFSELEIKDIAVAGDGEPTLVQILPSVLTSLVAIKNRYQLHCQLVLFTNGSNLHRPDLLKVLPGFFENSGQIWFKLDFWDEKSYLEINRSTIAFSQIIDNLVLVGSRFPIVLQSCFFRRNGQPFSVGNCMDYVSLLNNLQNKGVKLTRIQAYTIARKPVESFVEPWSNHEMDRLYQILHDNLSIEIQLVYSSGAKEQ
jgi:wyosine [tRNA(Phe)-imidazoG37] synthetase (radical SAM superfamily)